MNKLMMKAMNVRAKAVNKMAEMMMKREKGLNEVVTILIIIAVVAGLIGAFYLWAKGQLLPAVETQINDSIAQWFNPN